MAESIEAARIRSGQAEAPGATPGDLSENGNGHFRRTSRAAPVAGGLAGASPEMAPIVVYGNLLNDLMPICEEAHTAPCPV